MEPWNVGHSLRYDEAQRKHRLTTSVIRAKVVPIAHEDGLGCARGMFYGLIAEGLLAIMGLLMWELFFR